MEQDFKTIHEASIVGAINSILDAMSTVGGSKFDFFSRMVGKIRGTNPKEINISRNIAKSASALTATFPVIVTEATSLENAVMISKSIERKAVEMLRMLFTANQITNVTNAQEYLGKFHNNLSNKMDVSSMGVDDMIEFLGQIEHIDEVADFPADVQVGINAAMRAVCEDTKENIHYTLSTDLNKVSIQEFNIRGSLDNPFVWKAEEPLNELHTFNPNVSTQRTDDTGKVTDYETEYDDQGRPYSRPIRDVTSTTVTTRTIGDTGIDSIKQAYDIINKGVISTDVRKANEAVPSMIIVNFVSTGLGNGNNITTTAVIGVKAVLHYVSSEELINRIILKNSDRNTLLNFIRATTREISFFKDFLFGVKRAKIDALSKSGRGSNSKIWKLLELRADRARLNNASGRNNTNCAAITSMIISKEEVDIAKKFHRIDLTRPGTLLAIMRGYNLMCTAIIDATSNKVDFLYDDGSSKFETLSFMSLEREMAANEYKQVINLMAKGR